jgi:CBS domain-containing protein
MRAHQIMTRKVISVTPDTSIADAANTMLQQQISGLPVVGEAGNLVGIISEGDFIRRADIGTQRKRGRWLKFLVGPGRAATDFVHEQGRKVGEIMTAEPLTVTEDTTLEEIVTPVTRL